MGESISKTARRLIERMDELEFTQADLADSVGITQSAISQILSGKTLNSRHLPAIAEKLAINLGWLRGSTDEKVEMLLPDDTQMSEADAIKIIMAREAGRPKAALADYRQTSAAATTAKQAASLEDLGLVAIKEIDLSLGAGATFLGEAAVAETPRWFPRAWLREFTDAPPEKLVFARVRGDSMKPTIEDSAIVLIDLRRQRIDEQDMIWAIAVAEIGMVKRIWAQPDGNFKIKSDNPNVDPEIAVDGEMFVIGRVVGSLGRH